MTNDCGIQYVKNKHFPNTAKARLLAMFKIYSKLEDGSIDLSQIPDDKKCNSCTIGECNNCPTSRCHCNKACHGVPDMTEWTLKNG